MIKLVSAGMAHLPNSGFWKRILILLPVLAPCLCGASPAPKITSPLKVYSYPIPVDLAFRESDANVSVTGFDVSDLNVTNATVSDFNGSGHSYGFKLTPVSDPATVTISIAAGAAIGGGDASLPMSETLEYRFSHETRSASLVGWWKLDDGTGLSALNSGSAGAVRNLNLLDESAFVSEGKFGGAVEISTNNANSRMEVTGTELDIGAESTLMAWFKDLYPTGSWRTLFRGNQGDHQIMVENVSSSLGIFHQTNGGFRDSGASLATGSFSSVWRHVAAVGQNGSTMFYVDGQLAGTADRQSTTDVSRIGAWPGQRFARYLDDVRVYDVALAAESILAIYNGEGIPLVSGPANVVANPGTSLTLSYTGTVPNPAFPVTWSASGLPAGIDVNATTGVVSGTPTGTPDVNGTLSQATITATNDYGSSSVPLALTIYRLPSFAGTDPATDLALYGARLNGTLADASGTDCTVIAYVDVVDRGTDPNAWLHSFSLGTYSSGKFSGEISGLTIDSSYKFRFSVANAGGTKVW